MADNIHNFNIFFTNHNKQVKNVQKKLLGNNENEHGKLKNITLYTVKLLFVVKLF